jgi:hypothetical protein
MNAPAFVRDPAGPGSRPSGRAAAHPDASRFDPSRDIASLFATLTQDGDWWDAEATDIHGICHLGSGKSPEKALAELDRMTDWPRRTEG